MHECCSAKHEWPLNCCYNKLLKAKLTTSKDALRYFFCKDAYNLRKFVLNMLNFLKLYHCCILHDDLPFFFELYISDLTVIIPSMFCTDAAETVKSCIWSLYASSKSVFKGRQFFGKRAPLSSPTHFKLFSN